MSRVFIIVLDSCGIGEMPDAGNFGDAGAKTLKSCSTDPGFDLKNMKQLGLFNTDGIDYLDGVSDPKGAYARLA